MKYDGLWDLLYDVEAVKYPYLKNNGQISQCPALKVSQNMTYVIKSPVDLKISFNKKRNGIEIDFPKPSVPKVLCLSQEPIRSLDHIYFQTSFSYLFWTDSKDVQLWMHDVPEMLKTSEKNYYIASGMLPIGKYVRMINEPFIMKPTEEDVQTFEISRSEPIMGITFFSKDKISLIKKEPPKEILQAAWRNSSKKEFCPYTFSRDLFKKWITKGN